MNKKIGLAAVSIIIVIIGFFSLSSPGKEIVDKIKGNDSSELVSNDEEQNINSESNMQQDELDGLEVEERNLEEEANVNGVIFSVSNIKIVETDGDPDIPLKDIYVDMKIKNTTDEDVYIDSSVDIDLIDKDNKAFSKIDSLGNIKDFVKPRRDISGKVVFQVPAEVKTAKLKVTGALSENKASLFEINL